MFDVVRKHLAGLTRALQIAVLIALLIVPFLAGSYIAYVVALMLVNALAIMGVTFLLKYGGEVSIGHNVFMAVGAYGTAILSLRWGVPFPLNIVISVAASVVLGLVVAFPSRALSGIYLSVATLAMALTVPDMALSLNAVSGGFQAIYLPVPQVPGLSKVTVQYMLALIVFLLAVGAVSYFRKSRHAVALLMGRDHPSAAATFGVSATWCRMSAFAISAGITGLAGAIFAYVAQSVAPDSFTFWTAIYLLVGSVVGLQRTGMLATLFGAAFITLLPQYFAGAGALPPILFGVAIYLVILVATCGDSIWSGLRRMLPRATS